MHFKMNIKIKNTSPSGCKKRCFMGTKITKIEVTKDKITVNSALHISSLP